MTTATTMKPIFSQSQLQSIADALGDTSGGLTGSEIAHLLRSARMRDPNPDLTKRHRLFNAFAESQNTRHDRTHILAFIRMALKPENYIRAPERFEALRALDEGGTLKEVSKARTLTEAQRRAQELRSDLLRRGVHADVLRFCREELLADNYFHAVLEAVKSVAEKLRSLTGLTDDGATLVDRALGGDVPMVAINTMVAETERSEQKGFANLVKGTFGMFRNPTAHAPRIHWNMTKDDAEDLLSLVSLIHRRLDAPNRPMRP